MSDDSMNELRIDRSAFSVVDLADADNDLAYWLARTPEERWQGVELCRRVCYGEVAVTGRLQRVLEVVEREPGCGET